MKARFNFNSGCALFTSVAALLTFILAYNTAPLSGPFCKAYCYSYPYLDIASRFPRDYYWMVLTMIFLVSYLVLMVILGNKAEDKKKVFGHVTVVFAAISTAILLVNYFVQLSVIQPSVLKNEFDGISLLTQFNPHGIFIAMEEIGFLLMSISYLFAGLSMTVKTKLEGWIRGVFMGGFALTVLSLLVIIFTMGVNKEYTFEIASISFTWSTLIINGYLLFKLFGNRSNA